MNIADKINEFSLNSEKLRKLHELDMELFDIKINKGLTDMQIFFEEVEEDKDRINKGEMPLYEQIDALYKILKDLTYNDKYLYQLYLSISIQIKNEEYEQAEKTKIKIVKYEEKYNLIKLS